MNNNTTFNNLMPHWASSYEHFFFPTTTYSTWIGYKVLALLEAIPLFGRILVIMEKAFSKTPIPLSPKPLSERSIEPTIQKPLETIIKEPVDPTIADPLALSTEELLLCAQGLLLGTSAAIGLHWTISWLTQPWIASSILKTAIYVAPTTPLGAIITGAGALCSAESALFTPLQKDSDSEKKNLSSPLALFGMALASAPLAPAPIRVGVQGALTAYQMNQAFVGIGKALSQLGKRDTLTIARNVAVHSINIATSGYNLVSKAKDIIPELSWYGSYGLSLTTSKEYAQEIMGVNCPGFFDPAFSTSILPEWDNYEGYLPKLNFAWDTGYHHLSKNLGWLVVSVKSLCSAGTCPALDIPNPYSNTYYAAK